MNIVAFSKKESEFHNVNCGYHFNEFPFYSMLPRSIYQGRMRVWATWTFFSNLTKQIVWYYGVLLGNLSGILRDLFIIDLMVSLSIWAATASLWESVGKRCSLGSDFLLGGPIEESSWQRTPESSMIKLSPRALRENFDKVIRAFWVLYAPVASHVSKTATAAALLTFWRLL